MKKTFLALALVAGMSFNYVNAQVNRPHDVSSEEFSSFVTKVAENAKADNPGTVYGIIETTKDYYVVNTPIGVYQFDRDANGYVTIFGLKGKLVSSKNGIHVVETSFGRYTIDTKKCIVTKN